MVASDFRGWVFRSRRTAFVAGARLAGVGLTFGLTFVAERVLGADAFGGFAVALATGQVLGVPLASFERPSLRRVSRVAGWDGAVEEANSVVLARVTLVAGISVVCLVFIWGTLVFLEHNEAAAFWLMSGSYGLIVGALLPLQALHRGAGRFALGQAPNEIMRPAIAIGVLLVGAHLDVWDSGVTALGAVAVGAVSALILTASRLEGFRWLARRVAVWKRPLEEGVWSEYYWFLLATGAVLLLDRSYILLLGLLSEPRQAGAFAVALQVSRLGASALALANFRYGPMLASTLTHGNLEDSQDVVKRINSIAIIGSIPAILALTIVPQSIVWIFGPEYGEFGDVFRLVGVATAANVAGGPGQMTLAMAGEERVVAAALSGWVLVACSVGTVMVALLGATGAGLTFLVVVIGWNVSLVFLGKRRVGIWVSPIVSACSRLRRGLGSR